MNDLGGEDYYNEKIVKFIESIGYIHRIANSYLFIEDDGYINVSYNKGLSNKEYIEFHKNFYVSYYGKKDINYKFDNYFDFIKFMSSYHIKECRKLKLLKLK